MRIDELREREDVEPILAETLAAGWSAELGRPVTVRHSPHGAASGQEWRLQSTVSALVAEGRPSKDVARFVRDSFRYTPQFPRLPAQWLLGTMIGTRAGLQSTGRRYLAVDPGVPDSNDRLVVPGNRRVRTFDFGRGVTRVFSKPRFGVAATLAEIAVRRGGEGPFPPLLRADPAGGWYEEPILQGFVLPRCPPWWDRARLGADALSRVYAWTLAGAREVDAAGYVEQLCAAVAAGDAAASRFGPVAHLSAVARELGDLVTADAGRDGDRIVVGPSHGDMQPGNVFVTRATKDVVVIDWEYAAERSTTYDHLVFHLSARNRAGLASRCAAFVSSGGGHGPLAAGEADARRRALAIFLLEEVAWVAADVAQAGIAAAPRGWRQLAHELGEDGVARALGRVRFGR